jgi:uncharacterized cysteine cluster protein YcgN (CxxCxxCC family)
MRIGTGGHFSIHCRQSNEHGQSCKTYAVSSQTSNDAFILIKQIADRQLWCTSICSQILSMFYQSLAQTGHN